MSSESNQINFRRFARVIEEEMPSSITFFPGKFFPGDTVTRYYDHTPTLKEVAALTLSIGRNEDMRYPNGEGRRRIQRYLNACLNDDRLYDYRDLGL